MTSQPFDGRATPTDDSCQITIVIVDDQAILREGVRLILDKETGMHVVGEAGSIAEACDVGS